MLLDKLTNRKNKKTEPNHAKLQLESSFSSSSSRIIANISFNKSLNKCKKHTS